MSPEKIREHLRAEPFHPFRLFLTNGAAFDVPHPELMAVSRKSIFIAVMVPEDRVPDKSVHFDPLHMTHVELLDADTRPGMNGA